MFPCSCPREWGYHTTGTETEHVFQKLYLKNYWDFRFDLKGCYIFLALLFSTFDYFPPADVIMLLVLVRVCGSWGWVEAWHSLDIISCPQSPASSGQGTSARDRGWEERTEADQSWGVMTSQERDQASGDGWRDQEAQSSRTLGEDEFSWKRSYAKLQRLNLPGKLYPQVLI